MNAKTALLKIFLSGETVNIKTCFRDTGLTNLGREAGRMVERAFNVKLNREHKTGKSRYGCPVNWVDYTLPRTQENAKGIVDIARYIQENNGNPKSGAKTKKELK